MSSSFQPSPLLRYALIGDALASGATGLLLAGGTGLPTGLLGLPEQLMRYAGLFLLPYAARSGDHPPPSQFQLSILTSRGAGAPLLVSMSAVVSSVAALCA